MILHLLAPNFFSNWLYGMISASSLFPFKHWYSCSLRTPVARMRPISALSKACVISLRPWMCPISVVTAVAVCSTWSVLTSPTHAASASTASAVFGWDAAMLASRPCNSSLVMVSADTIKASERSSTSESSVSWSIVMMSLGSSSSNSWRGPYQAGPL